MSTPPDHTLILGGARSGKSAWAERRAEGSGLDLHYVATAQALDGEMQQRVEAHRRRRHSGWTTVEEPLELTATLESATASDRIVLVDCLTLWLTNLMIAGRDVDGAAGELVGILPGLRGPTLLVSNEVGQGVIPVNAMARAFVDHAGRLHQALAAACPRVVLVTAGLPLALKGSL